MPGSPEKISAANTPFKDLLKVDEGKYVELAVSEKDPDLVVKICRTEWRAGDPPGSHPLNDLERVRQDLSTLRENFGEYVPPAKVVLGKNSSGEKNVYIIQNRIEGNNLDELQYSDSVAEDLRIFFSVTMRVMLQSLRSSRRFPPVAIHPDFKGSNFVVGKDCKKGNIANRLYFIDTYPVQRQEIRHILENIHRLPERFSAAWAPLVREFQQNAQSKLEEFSRQNQLERESAEVKVKKFFRRRIQRMLKEGPGRELKEFGLIKIYLLDTIRSKSVGVLQGKEAALDKVLESVRRQDFPDVQSFIEHISSQMASLFIDTFPLSVLEKQMRDNLNNTKRYQEINRALSIEVSGQELLLHIPPIFLASPREFPELFKQGLRILAQKIVTEPSLQNIVYISGTSWIVARHTKMIERLGFSVISQDSGNGKASAIMEREKLLQLYG